MLQVNDITEITINDTCYLCRNRQVSHRVKLTDQEDVRINLCLCPNCTSAISRGMVELDPNKILRLL